MFLLNYDIIIAASITTLLLLFILVYVQQRLSIAPRIYYGFISIALPLSSLINLLKVPLIYTLFSSALENESLDFIDIIIWLAIVGISEEVIKILPITMPRLNKIEHNSQQLAILGWCLGTGFGIGEIWYLVFQISMTSEETQYNWLALLNGFGMERFFVVFVHAALTLIAVKGLEEGKRNFLKTLTIAAILHGFFDSPILLHQIGYFSYLEMIIIVFMEMIGTFVAAIYLFFTYYSSTISPLEERIVQKRNLLIRAKKAIEKKREE